MTNSQFCVRQRQKEQQRLNKLLILGFAGSAAIHGILAYALPRWSFQSPERVEEPIEMILVEKPKPKIESKPVVEPKPEPVKPPEPVKAQTPPPPVKPPEPVQPQTAPPKPTPKKVLTTPTPAPSQPIVSAPVENSPQSSSLSSSFTSSNSPAATSSDSFASSGKPGATGSVVATNSAPPRPQTNEKAKEGISCVSNCQPEYPAALEGVEGSAGVKLTVNPSGNVVGAELIDPHSNSGVNRQALLAARQMQFSSPGNNSAAVRVNIDFTVAGSEYDRARREEQEKRERAERERQEQEVARQQQLERERQAQQEQLERERQARQEQIERERQAQQQPEPIPIPTQTQPAVPPIPAPSDDEVDDEVLRKFRERIEQHQQQ